MKRRKRSSEKIRNNSAVDGHTTQFCMYRYSIMYIIIRLQSRKHHFMDVRRRANLEERRRYGEKSHWMVEVKKKESMRGEMVTRKAQRTESKMEDNLMRVFMVDGARVLSGIRTEVHWVSQASYFVRSVFSHSSTIAALFFNGITCTWLSWVCVCVTRRERVNISENGYESERDSRREADGDDGRGRGNAGKYFVDDWESSRKTPKSFGNPVVRVG